MAMEEGVSAAAMASVAATESAVVALRLVLSRVQQAVAWSGRALESVRVVAVSKTKPVAIIHGVCDASDHYFGENYVQELLDKVPQIADRLNRVVADLGRKPLKVLVQVNTSGKECGKIWSRSLRMCRISKACQIKLSCLNLVFSGLMTIGMLDYSSTPENSKTLANCRKEVCKELGVPQEQCELSMGMSADFKQAERNKLQKRTKRFECCITNHFFCVSTD